MTHHGQILLQDEQTPRGHRRAQGEALLEGVLRAGGDVRVSRDDDKLDTRQRTQGDVHGERHLDERRRAGEVLPPDGERENGHCEGDEATQRRRSGRSLSNPLELRPLPAWKRACLTHSLPERLIPRDVRTRTFDMLSFAVKYRKAIDDIAAERSLKLRKYELDEQEWKILGDLLMVLRMYKAATLAFSTNSVSTIANVIPMMDKIDALLTLQG
ncbi:hypothetical protein B0H14DRAFT_3149684 [Mycena olivaceomarginata]|nr:hypothetical protein B0H14DRAFT_3149684 [Mycena olivaceomarginata]